MSSTTLNSLRSWTWDCKRSEFDGVIIASDCPSLVHGVVWDGEARNTLEHDRADALSVFHATGCIEVSGQQIDSELRGTRRQRGNSTSLSKIHAICAVDSYYRFDN